MKKHDLPVALLVAVILVSIIGCDTLLGSKKDKDKDEETPLTDLTIEEIHTYGDYQAIHVTWGEPEDPDGNMDHIKVSWDSGASTGSVEVPPGVEACSLTGLTGSTDVEYRISVRPYNSDGEAYRETALHPVSTTDRHVRYVDKDATSSGSGLTWRHPYKTLEAAFSAVNTTTNTTVGFDIYVAEGTYVPAGNDQNATFTVPPGTRLYGGYSAAELGVNPDGFDRDLGAHTTILSGDRNGDDMEGGDKSDNCYHVVTGSAGMVLSGFTITRGNAAGALLTDPGLTDAQKLAPVLGGGLLIPVMDSPGESEIRECTFTENEGQLGGGAFVGDPSAGFFDCTFTGNTVMEKQSGPPPTGGALFWMGSAAAQETGTGGDGAEIQRSTFSSNTATGGESEAGALGVSGSMALAISDTTFSSNRSVSGAGAISRSSDDEAGNVSGIYEFELVRCTLSQNSTQGSGGAVSISGPQLNVQIVETTFTNNTASCPDGTQTTSQGGAITATIDDGNGLDIDISRSVFIGNRAQGTATWIEGGAIALGGYSKGATSISEHDMTALRLVNSLFVDNIADGTSSSGGETARGGAISTWEHCDLNIDFCTFYGNSCDDEDVSGTGNVIDTAFGEGGGAISTSADHNPCTVSVASSILWGNGPFEISYNGSGGGGSETLIVTYSDIEGPSPPTPYVGTGNINADPLFTNAGGDAANDYTLATDSPCVDVGKDGTLPRYDLAGNNRGETDRDMGAYER